MTKCMAWCQLRIAYDSQGSAENIWGAWRCGRELPKEDTRLQCAWMTVIMHMHSTNGTRNDDLRVAPMDTWQSSTWSLLCIAVSGTLEKNGEPTKETIHKNSPRVASCAIAMDDRDTEFPSNLPKPSVLKTAKSRGTITTIRSRTLERDETHETGRAP